MNKITIDRLLDNVQWEITVIQQVIDCDDKEDISYVTHEGILKIPGEIEIVCYQLSNGKRVFDERDICKLFGYFKDKP